MSNRESKQERQLASGAVRETFSELLGERGFSGIYAFSNEDSSGDYFTYPIRSDFFSIVVVDRGIFRVRVNLKEYSLARNTCAIAAPEALKEVVDVSSGCRYTGVIFTPEYLAAIGMHRHRVDALRFFTANHMPLLSLATTDQVRLTTLLTQLRDIGNYPEDYPFVNEITQYSFLVLMYEIAAIAGRTGKGGQPPSRLDRKEELTVNFATLVSQYFREKRKVHEYADMLFVTPKHLSRAVKDFTGKSAGELIDETIIREAKYLLLNPALNIQQITEVLHFPNQSQFGKFFKHHTGHSPLAYRKGSFK